MARRRTVHPVGKRWGMRPATESGAREMRGRRGYGLYAELVMWGTVSGGRELKPDCSHSRSTDTAFFFCKRIAPRANDALRMRRTGLTRPIDHCFRR